MKKGLYGENITITWNGDEKSQIHIDGKMTLSWQDVWNDEIEYIAKLSKEKEPLNEIPMFGARISGQNLHFVDVVPPVQDDFTQEDAFPNLTQVENCEETTKDTPVKGDKPLVGELKHTRCKVKGLNNKQNYYIPEEAIQTFTFNGSKRGILNVKTELVKLLHDKSLLDKSLLKQVKGKEEILSEEEPLYIALYRATKYDHWKNVDLRRIASDYVGKNKTLFHPTDKSLSSRKSLGSLVARLIYGIDTFSTEDNNKGIQFTITRAFKRK